MTCSALDDRVVLSLTGGDRVTFLQGLVSNDVTAAAPGHCIWAGYLTPQGRYLADFFIFSDGERLLIDCWAAQADMLATRLKRFKLRADVQIEQVPLIVVAGWGTSSPISGPLTAADPRLPEAGWRALLPEQDARAHTEGTSVDYERFRLHLGLPAPIDCEPEKTLLLEANFDRLNGVSWTKGCYMGQELTARTHYRALLKRRLLPVTSDTPLPAPGTPITLDGKEVGTLRSVSGSEGLAFLRREAWHRPLTCDTTTLTAAIPAWLEEENLPA